MRARCSSSSSTREHVGQRDASAPTPIVSAAMPRGPSIPSKCSSRSSARRMADGVDRERRADLGERCRGRSRAPRVERGQRRQVLVAGLGLPSSKTAQSPSVPSRAPPSASRSASAERERADQRTPTDCTAGLRSARREPRRRRRAARRRAEPTRRIAWAASPTRNGASEAPSSDAHPAPRRRGRTRSCAAATAISASGSQVAGERRSGRAGLERRLHRATTVGARARSAAGRPRPVFAFRNASRRTVEARDRRDPAGARRGRGAARGCSARMPGRLPADRGGQRLDRRRAATRGRARRRAS